MSRKIKGLDISLARRRYEERGKREDKVCVKHGKTESLKRYRGLIQAIFISFALGAGTAGILAVKVPIDGSDSPKIQLIHKLKYELFNLFDNIRGINDNKPEEQIEAPEEDKDDSKIHIKVNIPPDASCGPEDKQGCLVS